MRYEYRFETFGPEAMPLDIMVVVDAAGLEGWILTAVHDDSTSHLAVYYFVREIVPLLDDPSPT